MKGRFSNGVSRLITPTPGGVTSPLELKRLQMDRVLLGSGTIFAFKNKGSKILVFVSSNR